MGATTSHRDVVAVLSCSTVCFAGSEFNIQMREADCNIYREAWDISKEGEEDLHTCILNWEVQLTTKKTFLSHFYWCFNEQIKKQRDLWIGLGREKELAQDKTPQTPVSFSVLI